MAAVDRDAATPDAPPSDAPAADAPDICADVRVDADPVTPTVYILIDQSASMNADFDGEGTSRWDALRNFLLATPDGLIASLQGIVDFGLVLYTSFEPTNVNFTPAVAPCPNLTTVPAGPSNYTPIDDVYRTAPVGDETPTGDSIDAVLASLSDTPDPSSEPTVFILATDGEPDTCESANPQEGQVEAVSAVERAFAAGVRTFVIRITEADDVDDEYPHFQDMANAGLGLGPADPDAEFWVVGADATLREALMEIVGAELSCELTLAGEIRNLDEACSGTVRLNGVTLPCDDEDGWRAIDSTHIELLGEACETLTSGAPASLEATFPCGVVLI